MKVLVCGASGLIGSALIPELRAAGHQVVRLVRGELAAADEIRWNPDRGELDLDAVKGVDAAINLSGAGVSSRRWSESYKRKVRDSRLKSTELLVERLAAMSQPPKVLLSGSAVGYYGDTGSHTYDESGPRGEGFLAGLVGEWEAATAPAEAAGIRVCRLRTGVVLSRKGGALRLQLPIFKLGLGGRLGNGRQYISWIGVDDEVAAIIFLLTADGVRGPVNLVSPQPVTNREFTAALARAVHRPAVAAVPPFALRLALAGFADEGLLIGQRLTPKVLTHAGFTFRYPQVSDALAAILSS